MSVPRCSVVGWGLLRSFLVTVAEQSCPKVPRGGVGGHGGEGAPATPGRTGAGRRAAARKTEVPQLDRRPWETGGAGTQPLGKVPRPLPPVEVARACKKMLCPEERRGGRARLPRAVSRRRVGGAPQCACSVPPSGRAPSGSPRRLLAVSSYVLGERCQPARVNFLHRVCPTRPLSPQLCSPFSLHLWLPLVLLC